ncbi:MAG: DsbA family protein [Nanoarchaeota archaeon]
MSEHKDEDVIRIKKDSLWKYSTFLLLALLIFGAFLFFGKSNAESSNGVPTQIPSQGNQLPSQNTIAEVSADDDAVLGDKNAPVTIIEFSDYQCPFCRKFWTDTLPSIKKDYIDIGKVKFIYRDFPLGFHPNAEPAAEAAECAREVGKGDVAYFKMHDKIFEEQNKLDGGTVRSTVFDGWDKEVLKKWAKDLGYDIGNCLDSGKYASEVQKDESDGQAAGVQGTPGFFINGKPLSGAQPYSAFKQVIDAELQ